MIRSALRLCAGIILTACFACAPAPVPLPPPPPPAPSPAAAVTPPPAVYPIVGGGGSAAAVVAPTPALAPKSGTGMLALGTCDPSHPGNPSDPSDPGTFVPNVVMLKPSFDPTNFTTPPIDTVTPISPLIKADLKAAFLRAPMEFRTALCGLDGVYIDPTAGHSWGFRNYKDTKRYIGLSLSLWSNNKTLLLHEYENLIFGAPLNWNTIDASPPAYQPANLNDGPMTILAALAHEFGHVLWSDTFIKKLDGKGVPDTNQFCSAILTSYYEQIPGSPSLQKIPFWQNDTLQPRPWTVFETRDNNPADIPDDNTEETDPGGTEPRAAEAKAQIMWNNVVSQVPKQVQRAHRILWRLLAKGRPFPSVLGAFSANEQFVETFTLNVLMNAGLTSLPLLVDNVNGVDQIRDIPQERLAGFRKRLGRVMSCF